ncbi:hypothetical protein C2845_PM02G01210 [Panicum miliaceum]|uniref:Phospholipase A2 n=1 Tax=Panicum miliaceum TaxID=4540 RepID=A0A3L6S968_PANMI|nr:hypothetical protein C2845_PM02G01210 [Panicum miliaceum]
MARGGSWRRLAVAGVLVAVCAAALAPPAAALDIGIQSAGDGVSKQQACSRTCESDHCTTPPSLRYGKYCGILYSGCPGEAPCDALDACCMHHDNCVQAKNHPLNSTTRACVLRGLPEHGVQRGAAGLSGEAAGGHVHVRGQQVHDRRGHRRDLARHRGRRRRRQGAAQAVAHAEAEAVACLRGRWVVHLLRARCRVVPWWWCPGRLLAGGPGCVGSHGGLCRVLPSGSQPGQNLRQGIWR